MRYAVYLHGVCALIIAVLYMLPSRNERLSFRQRSNAPEKYSSSVTLLIAAGYLIVAVDKYRANSMGYYHRKVFGMLLHILVQTVALRTPLQSNAGSYTRSLMIGVSFGLFCFLLATSWDYSYLNRHGATCFLYQSTIFEDIFPAIGPLALGYIVFWPFILNRLGIFSRSPILAFLTMRMLNLGCIVGQIALLEVFHYRVGHSLENLGEDTWTYGQVTAVLSVAIPNTFDICVDLREKWLTKNEGRTAPQRSALISKLLFVWKLWMPLICLFIMAVIGHVVNRYRAEKRAEMALLLRSNMQLINSTMYSWKSTFKEWEVFKDLW
jgi:hypothetical protein